jgi:hypothetical protein
MEMPLQCKGFTSIQMDWLQIKWMQLRMDLFELAFGNELPDSICSHHLTFVLIGIIS